MVALYVNSPIVGGFFLSWCCVPPQSFEHIVWDCVWFYTIHTFLDPSVESQFIIVSMSYNFLFGSTTTSSLTLPNSHFLSGQSWHASSSLIVLYLWLGARRPTTWTLQLGCNQWHWVAGTVVAIKYASIPILVKVSPVTGWSTKIGICSLEFVLFRLQIVTLFVSSFCTTKTTQLSFGCKCDWCVGILALSIKMTCISPTQTTGCNLAKTSALACTSAMQSFPPQLTFPCFRRTFSIIVDHVFLHKLNTLCRTWMRSTAKPFTPPSLAVMVLASLISLTFPFRLVNLTRLP